MVLLNNVRFIYFFDTCVKSHAIIRNEKIATHPIYLLYAYKICIKSSNDQVCQPGSFKLPFYKSETLKSVSKNLP